MVRVGQDGVTIAIEQALECAVGHRRRRNKKHSPALPPAELTASFAQVTFTSNLQEAAIRTEAQQAVTVGLIKPVTNWTAIFDN